jgi:glucokinase
MDLIADIGATNSRCALLDEHGRTTRSGRFLNHDFDSLATLLGTFADGAKLSRAALAIAAPITGNEIVMTNVDWRFSQESIRDALKLRTLRVLNDFEAVAMSLPMLGEGDCHRVGTGNDSPHATRAVLGPGSGLGVAAIVPGQNGWTTVSGEGGHVTLPALTDTEASIIAEHADADGHCSAERLLSGPGLARIHASLARHAGCATEDLTPAEITGRLQAGDEIASRAYEVFFALLGTVAGNLALTVGARGGVYIAGGIVPRVIDSFERSQFRERFVAKGRYRSYLEPIRTQVITVQEPAFPGLRSALGFS